MEFCDTHLHLDDDQFVPDRTGVINRAADAGVRSLIAVATTAASSRATLALADHFHQVLAAVGIQPNYTQEATDDDWNRIIDWLAHPKTVAIGETGLDYYWDFAPISLQRDWFIRHIEQSLATDLPIIIHMREGKHGTASDSCFHDIIATLRSVSGGAAIRGVMHSFTGTLEQALECLELGLSISFAGMLTFKNASSLREVAAALPPDRILIETDAPYLTPHPFRGRSPNEPAMLVHTAQCLADIRGISLAEIAAMTTANARAVFTGMS